MPILHEAIIFTTVLCLWGVLYQVVQVFHRHFGSGKRPDSKWLYDILSEKYKLECVRTWEECPYRYKKRWVERYYHHNYAILRIEEGRDVYPSDVEYRPNLQTDIIADLSKGRKDGKEKVKTFMENAIKTVDFALCDETTKHIPSRYKKYAAVDRHGSLVFRIDDTVYSINHAHPTETTQETIADFLEEMKLHETPKTPVFRWR